MFQETPNERMARLVNSAPVYLPEYEGEIEGVIRASAETAVNSRNAAELAARVKAAGGKLTAGANSSDLIVAVNNTLRFSVTRNAAGQYEITDRLNATSLLLLAIPAVFLLVLISKK